MSKVLSGGRLRREAADEMKMNLSWPRDRDLAFFAAWEDGVLPRSIDAGTILRVRQIMRARARGVPGERR